MRDTKWNASQVSQFDKLHCIEILMSGLCMMFIASTTLPPNTDPVPM